MQKSKLTNIFIITTFTLLYLFVSIISMIHTVAFFQLSNPYEILAISLAVAFELGAAASLATVVTQEAMNKFIVWALFIILTLFQMMGNTYYAYHNLAEYSDWSELFALNELSEIEQKRYLAIISGAILPVVALGYIKCLVDYLKSKQKLTVASNEQDFHSTGSTETITTEKIEEPEEKISFIPYKIAKPEDEELSKETEELLNDVKEENQEEAKEEVVEQPVVETPTAQEQLSKETEEFLENDAQEEVVEEPAAEEQKRAKKSIKDSLFFKKKSQNDLKKTSNK